MTTARSSPMIFGSVTATQIIRTSIAAFGCTIVNEKLTTRLKRSTKFALYCADRSRKRQCFWWMGSGQESIIEILLEPALSRTSSEHRGRNTLPRTNTASALPCGWMIPNRFTALDCPTNVRKPAHTEVPSNFISRVRRSAIARKIGRLATGAFSKCSFCSTECSARRKLFVSSRRNFMRASGVGIWRPATWSGLMASSPCWG